MSLRRSKFPTYNRMEEREKEAYWLSLYDEEPFYEPIENFWDPEDNWWHYYGAPGYVASMTEFHQMKLLTLLRRLCIGNARLITKGRGW